MTFLRLPRIDASNALATQHAVAAGLNGVTPEIRQHALRKIRAAVRNQRLAPSRVHRALARGDAGLASLFPVRELPSPPAILPSTLPGGPGGPEVTKALSACKWVLELAMRRGVAPDGLCEALSGPAVPPNAAHLLLATWNCLLRSYRPDWMPEASCAHDGPRMLALPSALRNHGSACVSLLTIEPTSISRMFVDTDSPEYALVRHALAKLERATVFPIAALDPDGGRECYIEYAMGGSMLDDLSQTAIWPEGASAPTFDVEAVSNLLEEFGHDSDSAVFFIECATQELARARELKVAPSVEADAAMTKALRESQSANARRARAILTLVERLDAMPAPPDVLQHDITGYGLPVHLLATWDGDTLQGELSNAIDAECSDEAPSISFACTTASLPRIDAALQRLVAEMLIAEYVYSLLMEGGE